MSTTYDIACHDCKKRLWIGQRNYIYTGQPETMRDLCAFLYAHENHHLGFHSDQYDWDEYESIDLD